MSLPIDWTLNTTKSVYEGFKDEFKDYFNSQYCVDDVYVFPKTEFKCLFNTKYRINITHESIVTQKNINKYSRRVDRLVKILNSDKNVLFVRNLLDCHILDDVHVKYLNRELEIDKNCNDIIWLYRLKDMLSEKYKNLSHDMLIIHYNLINGEVKRDDIIYKKMLERHFPVNWDYLMCVEAIKSLNSI